MNYGYIYLVTDLRNGLKYVGQHLGKFNSRYFGSGLIIKRTVKKYGEINFKVEAIDFCLNQEELNEQEIFWIRKYACLWPKGYNLIIGAHGSGIKNETTKDRISKALIGKKHSKEHIKNNRRAMLKAFKNPKVIEKIKQNTIKAMYRPEVQVKLRKHKSKETKKRKFYKSSSPETHRRRVESRKNNGRPWHTEDYKNRMRIIMNSPEVIKKMVQSRTGVMRGSYKMREVY